MSTGGGHPLGTPPLGALVIALSMAALVALGVTTTAVATPSGANARAASALVTETRTAMTAAGPVSAVGTGMTRIPGVGKANVTESDYVDRTSGSQLVKATSSRAGAGDFPTASTVDIGGAVYVDADAAFWSASIGVASSQTASVANRWVQVPKDSPIYAPAAADLTVPSLIQDLFNAPTYHEGSIRTVDGVRAVAITYQNRGADSGPVTCYLAVGTHLPVEVTVSGLTLHLSAWGVSRVLAAPTGAIPMPSLTPTTSATPLVA